jgi:hypothetical protein
MSSWLKLLSKRLKTLSLLYVYKEIVKVILDMYIPLTLMQLSLRNRIWRMRKISFITLAWMPRMNMVKRCLNFNSNYLMILCSLNKIVLMADLLLKDLMKQHAISLSRNIEIYLLLIPNSILPLLNLILIFKKKHG